MVEFVFSASRFKLLVPKEHVLVSFVLAGIRTPATRAVDDKPADPLAEEALQYVRVHRKSAQSSHWDRLQLHLGARRNVLEKKQGSSLPDSARQFAS